MDILTKSLRLNAVRVLLWGCDLIKTAVVTVVVTKDQTDRPPCNPLHDEVFAGLQVFDDIFAQSGVSLDEALDDFVEVKGSKFDHIQYPGKTDVCFDCVTAAAVVVASSLKTAL